MLTKMLNDSSDNQVAKQVNMSSCQLQHWLVHWFYVVKDIPKTKSVIVTLCRVMLASPIHNKALKNKNKGTWSWDGGTEKNDGQAHPMTTHCDHTEELTYP